MKKRFSEDWFLGLADARRMIEDWREDYNSKRPHTALKGLTPNEQGKRLIEIEER